MEIMKSITVVVTPLTHLFQELANVGVGGVVAAHVLQQGAVRVGDKGAAAADEAPAHLVVRAAAVAREVFRRRGDMLAAAQRAGAPLAVRLLRQPAVRAPVA